MATAGQKIPLKGCCNVWKKSKAVKELVLIVEADGQIQAEGDLSGKADNPMVQVLFADNKTTSGIKQNGSNLVFCI